MVFSILEEVLLLDADTVPAICLNACFFNLNNIDKQVYCSIDGNFSGQKKFECCIDIFNI